MIHTLTLTQGLREANTLCPNDRSGSLLDQPGLSPNTKQAALASPKPSAASPMEGLAPGGAQFPRELIGIWAESPEICGQASKDQAWIGTEGAISIGAAKVQGYEESEQLTEIRRTASNLWEVDVQWASDEETERYRSVYSLETGTLLIVSPQSRRTLVRCP